GEHDGSPFLVLEYVNGGTFAQKLAGRPQPARKAAGVVETLARAVYAAHQRGLTHGDLRPEAVLLMPDGTPKASDSGAAGAADAGGRRAAGVRGLGAIFYEALTGRPPLFRNTRPAAPNGEGRRELVPPGRVQPGVPPELDAVCLTCLHPRRQGRYPN